MNIIFTMPDYSKGKIYKLVCNDTGLTYIGSTTTELNRRLLHHKYNLDCSSKEIIQNNNYHIELIEDMNATCKFELLQRERYWIENTKCVNKHIPNRTIKEYYQQNKEQLKEYSDKRYQQNKEKKKEYSDKRYQQNKEQIKEQHKQRYQQNREQILERNRLRYQQKKLQHSLSSSSS